jgi:hypothetical protein
VFERFTDDARRTTVLAQEEARLLGHDHIGSEHLLLGALHSGGTAAQALAPFGLTLERVRDEVAARTEVGPAVGGGHIPFTADAKKAMEMALREALALGDSNLSTAHLILGVLAVDDGLGLQVVTAVTDDVDEIRTWLRQNRGLPSTSGPPTAPQDTVRIISSAGPRPLGGAFGGNRCAFCDRDLWEVQASVAGPHVAICGDCVEAAAVALRDAAASGAPTHDPLPLPPRVFGEPAHTGEAALVVAAVRGAIASELPPDEQAACMEDGARLVPLIEQAGARFRGQQISLVIGALRFVAEHHAQVRYEIVIGGGPRVPFTGDVVRRDGRWMVTRDTIVHMIGRAGVHPPPDEA